MERVPSPVNKPIMKFTEVEEVGEGVPATVETLPALTLPVNATVTYSARDFVAKPEVKTTVCTINMVVSTHLGTLSFDMIVGSTANIFSSTASSQLLSSPRYSSVAACATQQQPCTQSLAVSA